MNRLATLPLVMIAAGCAGSADLKSPNDEVVRDGGAPNTPPRSPSPGPSGTGAGAAASDAGAPALPPEREERREFETPRAGARFVYVANPRRDSVAVIDSMTLGIRTEAVGDTPTALTTMPGQDVALVINAGTRDVNILRTQASGISAVTRVPVVPGANRLSVAPDGRHAIAWFDSSARVAADRQSVGSFQDVSVIALDPAGDRAVAMSVGFRPTDVVFSRDGAGAFVITEDGISVLRLGEIRTPAVAPLVRLGDAPAGTSEPRDVSVTPDGKYAIARREGSPALLLVDLAAGTVSTADVGGPVTDLDLAPGGEFALAVVRADNAYVRLAIPGGWRDPAGRERRVLSGETIGSASVAPDGKAAVLYTTAGTPPRRTRRHRGSQRRRSRGRRAPQEGRAIGGAGT